MRTNNPSSTACAAAPSCRSWPDTPYAGRSAVELLVVGWRNDHHRPPGMFGDLVRHAPLEHLLQPSQPTRPNHDHRSVELGVRQPSVMPVPQWCVIDGIGEGRTPQKRLQ
jgi:hypothetical protein